MVAVVGGGFAVVRGVAGACVASGVGDVGVGDVAGWGVVDVYGAHVGIWHRLVCVRGVLVCVVVWVCCRWRWLV